LAALFRETGPAHHQAFIETNGNDPEWPLWYASYLHPRLSIILEGPITKSKLVQLLVSASEDQAHNAPKADWSEYFADFFLAHLWSKA